MANRTLARICVPLIVAALWARPDAAVDDFAALLARASAYVADFEIQFAAIIWHETYDQVDQLPQYFGASGSRFTRIARRHIESEMLFISSEADGTWLTVRDVISVDGKPVPRRLPALLASKNVGIRDLRALSEENGRYNIGAILRNFNEPTLALLFLDSRYRSRFQFVDGGSDEVNGQVVRRIQFKEVVTPTVIRTLDRDVRTSGALLVEPMSGRVVRTELMFIQDKNDTRGAVDVSYGMNAKLGVMVPVEMHEWYGYARSTPNEGISCTAKYSDFRRFETSGRLIR